MHTLRVEGKVQSYKHSNCICSKKVFSYPTKGKPSGFFHVGKTITRYKLENTRSRNFLHWLPPVQNFSRLLSDLKTKSHVQIQPSSAKIEGKIVKFGKKKGFGFIKDKTTNTEIYFTESDMRGETPIHVNDPVLFKVITVQEGNHKGKKRATEIEIVKSKGVTNKSRTETEELKSELAALKEKFEKMAAENRTTTFGKHIKGYKNTTALSIDLPFQNRETEIETIARTCLENLKVSRMMPSESNQEKTTLLTSAQMWGSGKSWLGIHFLPQFCSPQFASLRSKLAEEFGAEAVNILANSMYIQIDLRRWQDVRFGLPEGRVDLFVLYNLVGTMTTYFPEDRPFWESQLDSDWIPRTIMDWFSNKYKKTFFLHFDEVDAILSVLPELRQDEVVGLNAAKRFYDFWTYTHPIIMTGNFLFFTGRSVFLYAFGQGLYRSPNFTSPGHNNCLLLDTLKPQLIQNILAENPGIKSTDTQKHLASLIYQRTGGIPRFVGFAVQWLRKQGIGKDSEMVNISDDIFGDKFRDFVREDKKARSELYPMGSLGDSPRIQQLYARLIALSALGVPLDITASITNPEAWGIRKDNRDKYLEVPLLDVLRLYNLWIMQDESDGQWRILFPDIVLDEIAFFKGDKHPDEVPHWVSSLPYWIAFNKTRSAQVWDKGTLFERIVANNMELAILDNLGIAKKSATFAERFPFLAQSYIANEIPALSPASPYGQLPKIVNHDKGRGGAASLDSLSKEEQEQRLQLLQNYIAQPPSYLQQEKRLFKGDWKYLLKIVHPGILYIPVAKSASADLIYFTPTMNSVHFQFKAEQDALTMDNVIVEAQKVYAEPLIADGKTLTLVFVALKVNQQTITKNIPESNFIRVSNSKENLSIVFPSRTTLAGSQLSWCIPDNMDIVVVLKKGLEQLITKHNLSLFEQKQNVTIQDIVTGNT